MENLDVREHGGDTVLQLPGQGDFRDEEEDADLAKHLGSVFASVTLELLEDGSYDLEVDSTSMIPAFRVGMVGYIEEVCEQFGLTVEEFEQMNGQRKVYLSEAMERLHVKSRSTMWHWSERGFLIQDHDENGHVFYPDFKIRRAERGEHPENGGPDDGEQ